MVSVQFVCLFNSDGCLVGVVAFTDVHHTILRESPVVAQCIQLFPLGLKDLLRFLKNIISGVKRFKYVFRQPLSLMITVVRVVFVCSP
jgi:hypothetical protein